MDQMTMDRTAQDLKSLTDDWAASERQGDTTFMERTLTDDFSAVGPRGFVLNKEQWLQRFRSGGLKYESLDWDDVNVRTYGDAAVVTGHERGKVKYQNQAMENDLRTTLVWVRQDGRWLLAAAQMSPILGMP